MVEPFGWIDAIGLAIPLLAVIPFSVALRAYFRTRTARVAFFTAAFGTYLLKGLLIGAQVLFPTAEKPLDAAETILDAVTLALFFLGMIKA